MSRETYLISPEEHDSHGIVQLVHTLEVGHFIQIAEVDDREVFYAICDLVEYLILAHTFRVVITSESNDYEALFFTKDGLVNVPASSQVRKDNGAHVDSGVINDDGYRRSWSFGNYELDEEKQNTVEGVY